MFSYKDCSHENHFGTNKREKVERKRSLGIGPKCRDKVEKKGMPKKGMQQIKRDNPERNCAN